jgi:hypothetical protein
VSTMALAARKPIDWEELEAEYRSIRQLIDDVQLPSPEEIDCFKASLAAPALVSSDLRNRIRFGNRYPLVQGEDRTWMLEQVLRILRRNEQIGSLPEHICADLRDHIGTVEQAIITRSLSLEFVYSWGELQQALGGLIALLVGDEAAEKHFVKGLKAGTSKNTTLQRYWYSHWMIRHGFFARRANRVELKHELAELCLEIKRRRREPRIHRAQWFASMIERDGPDPEDWVLKTTYARLPPRDVQRMANNRLVPLSALPPLSAEEFPLIDSNGSGPVATHPEGRKQRL